MLAQDVRALAADPKTPKPLRAVVRALAERYSYPVDFQIIDAAGKVFAQAAANDHVPSYRAVVQQGLAAKEAMPAPPRKARRR